MGIIVKLKNLNDNLYFKFLRTGSNIFSNAKVAQSHSSVDSRNIADKSAGIKLAVIDLDK